MTCIVGFAEKGKVWIGGDSAGVAGWCRTIRADTKVFVRDGFVYGYTTSFRMGQLLKYKFIAPKQPDKMPDHEYLCTSWIDEIRKCLKEGGFSEIAHNRETGGAFLLGYRGRLYSIASDFQVGEPIDGLAAIGCGADFALGAMFASKGRPESRIRTALAAAALFSCGVSGPFVVESVGGGSPR